MILSSATKNVYFNIKIIKNKKTMYHFSIDLLAPTKKISQESGTFDKLNNPIKNICN